MATTRRLFVFTAVDDRYVKRIAHLLGYLLGCSLASMFISVFVRTFVLKLFNDLTLQCELHMFCIKKSVALLLTLRSILSYGFIFAFYPLTVHYFTPLRSSKRKRHFFHTSRQMNIRLCQMLLLYLSLCYLYVSSPDVGPNTYYMYMHIVRYYTFRASQLAKMKRG